MNEENVRGSLKFVDKDIRDAFNSGIKIISEAGEMDAGNYNYFTVEPLLVQLSRDVKELTLELRKFKAELDGTNG